MEYTPTARDTEDSLSSTLKNRIVMFILLQKNNNNQITVPRWSSRSHAAFSHVVVNVVV